MTSLPGVPDADLSSVARIRNIALRGFARDGVDATSIRRVAAEAGVSPGLVQHHYPSKLALRAAVDEHVLALAFERFSILPEGDGDLFQMLGDQVTAFVSEHPDALLYVARAALEGQEAALGLFDAFVGLAEASCRTMIEAGVVRSDIDVEWAALHIVIFNLGTLLLRTAIERRLGAPFFSHEQLRRWNVATTDMLCRGAYAPGGGSAT
jgi:AcrR family transcriptional regulator